MAQNISINNVSVVNISNAHQSVSINIPPNHNPGESIANINNNSNNNNNNSDNNINNHQINNRQQTLFGMGMRAVDKKFKFDQIKEEWKADKKIKLVKPIQKIIKPVGRPSLKLIKLNTVNLTDELDMDLVGNNVNNININNNSNDLIDNSINFDETTQTLSFVNKDKHYNWCSRPETVIEIHNTVKRNHFNFRCAVKELKLRNPTLFNNLTASTIQYWYFKENKLSSYKLKPQFINKLQRFHSFVNENAGAKPIFHNNPQQNK